MYSTIILHIPHSSTVFGFADRDALGVLGEDFIRRSIPLIDWYTDELFMPYNLDNKIVPVVFDTCRTLVDVERMCDDPLESRGLGITAFALFPKWQCEYGVRLTYEDDTRYMKKYLEHQHRLANLLVEHHNSILIDCHSFSSGPTVLQPDANKNKDVDICIGFNEDRTKPSRETLELVKNHFQEKGYRVTFNVPFSNSKTVETPAKYTSLMIEVNKALYMGDGERGKGKCFDKVRRDIVSLYGKLC